MTTTTNTDVQFNAGVDKTMNDLGITTLVAHYRTTPNEQRHILVLVTRKGATPVETFPEELRDDIARRLSGSIPTTASERLLTYTPPTGQVTIAPTKIGKEHILAKLRTLGVQFVNIDYDGSGDEGNIDEVTATAGDSVVPIPEDLEETLRDYAWAILADHYGGWETNDGATGQIAINVDEGMVRINHSTRVMETIDEETYL